MGMMNQVEIGLSKSCIYCGKEITGRRKKYCSDICSFRYKSIKNDGVKKFSVSQHLRMQRAGRSQRLGRVGCRFN